MAAEYYRPNLTSEQRDLLMVHVTSALKETYGIEDPDFDPLYVLLLKLRECKRISTEAKPKANSRKSDV